MKTQPARIVIRILLLVLLLATATACGSSAESMNMSQTASMPAMEEKAAYDMAAPMAPGSGDEGLDQSLDVVQQPRIIIYTGDIELVVADTAETITGIAALTAEVGGYVSDTNMYNSNGVPRGRMTIKVPVESYQQVLQRLRDSAIRVERESSSSQDVTEEYVDLEARKGNLERTEAALQKLLETRQETGKTEDILEVYRELTSVRGQIEQIQGRMTYLSRSAAMSTINIDVTPDILAQPLTVAGWEPKGVAKEALQTLIEALQGWAEFVIWVLIVVLPVLILYLAPVVLVIWLFVRWVRGRRAKKKAEKAQSEAEEASTE